MESHDAASIDMTNATSDVNNMDLLKCHVTQHMTMDDMTDTKYRSRNSCRSIQTKRSVIHCEFCGPDVVMN